ncbi:MAG: hypothetical protein OJJ54_13465 [Pseudonocardia sp.]|nr:hypothetical protein [Pseudonocardia sp.]
MLSPSVTVAWRAGVDKRDRPSGAGPNTPRERDLRRYPPGGASDTLASPRRETARHDDGEPVMTTRTGARGLADELAEVPGVGAPMRRPICGTPPPPDTGDRAALW